jgi:hypothetical protein
MRRQLLVALLLTCSTADVSVGQFQIQTPAGLSPGDEFRIVFVTDGTTAATSPNISTYNSFVNSQADGAIYNGTVVSWSAIASTNTTSAISNIGTFNVPVYLSNGTLVSTSDGANGLWSSIGPTGGITTDLLGNPEDREYVFTGTGTDGFATGSPLGNLTGNTAQIGNGGVPGPTWIDNGLVYSLTGSLQMYGISEELTVPYASPEPGTLTIVLVTMGVAVGCTLRRRRLTATPSFELIPSVLDGYGQR